VRILSPVDNLAEAGRLVDAGADELYGGYVSPAWRKKYSMLGSANQRYFPSAQIKDRRELRGIIRAAHAGGAKFYLTLNAPYYTAGQYDDLITEVKDMYGLGVDAFIVSDIGLILRLGDALPGVPVHLSTLQGVFNSKAAAFFAGLGVKRMVFPRELTVSEMAGVVKNNPGVEFDSFIMVGKCPNVEGFCTFTHNNPELIWPCEEPYERTAQGPAADSIMEAQAGWSKVNRRAACGLCALPGLVEAGITALKLVGRGGPSSMKLKVIKAVKDALALSGSGMPKDEYCARAKEIYRSTFGADCSPYVCYFPEIWGHRSLHGPK
jgi:U32 family peptidase